jgi:hypothetical protein
MVAFSPFRNKLEANGAGPFLRSRPKVHYRVHKSHPLVPNGIFPSEYPLCSPLLTHACYVPCTFHAPGVYHSIIILDEKYKL